jgi:hypothetical protein
MSRLTDAGFPIEGAAADVQRNRISVSLSAPVTPGDVEAMARTLAGEPAVALDTVCLDAPTDVPVTIAPGTPLEVIVLPDEHGDHAPDLPVECGPAEFRLGALSRLASIEEVDPSLRAVLDGWLAGPEGGFWPQDGWLLLDRSDDTAQFVNLAAEEVWFVSAEMGRNGWIWSGASSAGVCDVRRALPDGLGAVDWELDPASPPPAAETTELHLLVTERACASGAEVGARLLGPEVVETDTTVRIAFAAIPLTGGQNCPSNPPTAVTVALSAPLAGRELRDGLVIGRIDELVPD